MNQQKKGQEDSVTSLIEKDVKSQIAITLTKYPRHAGNLSKENAAEGFVCIDTKSNGIFKMANKSDPNAILTLTKSPAILQENRCIQTTWYPETRLKPRTRAICNQRFSISPSHINKKIQCIRPWTRPTCNILLNSKNNRNQKSHSQRRTKSTHISLWNMQTTHNPKKHTKRRRRACNHCFNPITNRNRQPTCITHNR